MDNEFSKTRELLLKALTESTTPIVKIVLTWEGFIKNVNMLAGYSFEVESIDCGFFGWKILLTLYLK